MGRGHVGAFGSEKTEGSTLLALKMEEGPTSLDTEIVTDRALPYGLQEARGLRTPRFAVP